MNVNTENLDFHHRKQTRIFSRVARMVDEKGSVVILKNNSNRGTL